MTRIFRKNSLRIIILFTALLFCLSSCAFNEKTDETKVAEELNGALRITCLDVGKGDCIVIEKDGSFIMIDTGYDDTADKVLSFLSQSGIDHLDVLIISHYDKDHVGGASVIAESLPVSQIYLPGYDGESKYYKSLMKVIEKKSISAEKVSEDVSFTIAGMDLQIFASTLEYVHEEGKEEGNDNDVSIVVALTWEEDSYLFAGDLEKDGIDAFLSAGHPSYDVVKMPHHGRKKSNSDDFINSVNPKIALITDSVDEPVNDKVIGYLDKIGAEYYCSADCGNIVITSTGNGVYSVKTEKESANLLTTSQD